MRTSNIILELQPYTSQIAFTPKQMYANACSADNETLARWLDTWLSNISDNQKRFGPFKDNSVGNLWRSKEGLPCIIAGAGPSLTNNIHLLKDRPAWLPLVSCLHSFHAMEDADARVDYYVTLDAGADITTEEVTEGAKKPEIEYWEKTKEKTLIAFIGTSPKLIEKWQGKILWYNAPIPGGKFKEECDKIEPFNCWVSNGGHVLGAAFYIAKAWLGCPTSIFIGADFAFSNRDKIRFHAWDSKYDENIGQTIRWVDIWGNSVKTWPSYWNFAQWWAWVSKTLPGIYINCSEDGILGAFREGNLDSIQQRSLAQMLEIYKMHDRFEHQATKPDEFKTPESQLILI